MIIIELINFQAEADRFEDTSRILKDYYKCMLTPMPEEVTSEYPRLPLIDVWIRNDYFLKFLKKKLEFNSS